MSSPSIVIDVAIPSGGKTGGVEQFIIGLVKSLGELEGEEQYTLVSHPRNPDWIRPYASTEMEVVTRDRLVDWIRSVLGPFDDFVTPIVKSVAKQFGIYSGSEVAESSGFYAALGADVVHFPYQQYRRTEVPTIYNPHDLQHETYPEFFTDEELAFRRSTYRAGCLESAAVDVPSAFTKSDIISTYNVEPDTVYPIPRGPPITVYDEATTTEPTTVKQRYNLPDEYAFYPAKPWPHKNHRRLIDAIARLRNDHNEIVNVVFTGSSTDRWKTVEKHVNNHQLEDQIQYLGYVPGADMRALYRLASFVVFPSLFEGGGFPLLEAWAEKTPVTCSDTTALGEKAGDAALRFDPTDINSVADAISRLHRDPELRASLVERGSARISRYNWGTTARCYRALYREIAGAVLTDTQRDLLDRVRRGELA